MIVARREMLLFLNLPYYSFPAPLLLLDVQKIIRSVSLERWKIHRNTLSRLTSLFQSLCVQRISDDLRRASRRAMSIIPGVCIRSEGSVPFLIRFTCHFPFSLKCCSGHAFVIFVWKSRAGIHEYKVESGLRIPFKTKDTGK